MAGKTDSRRSLEGYDPRCLSADNEYDFEKETEEYKRAVALTDEWGALLDKYEEMIFEILRGEGVEIPPTGRIVVLVPFMKRYGYDDMGGWWIKSE